MVKILHEGENEVDVSGLQPLVYDRSEADVLRARFLKEKMLEGTATKEEVSEWKTSLRGALNAEDLNRMEEWTAKLTSEVASLGFSIPTFVKKSWHNDGMPAYKNDIDRLRNGIVALGDSSYVQDSWKEILFLPTISFDQLNAMEWDLSIVYQWINRASKNMIFAGDMFAGEEWI